MGQIVIPWEFVGGDYNYADRFNANFTVIKNLLNGNLDADNFKDGAVTEGKLAAGAVAKTKLKEGAYSRIAMINTGTLAGSKFYSVNWQTIISGTFENKLSKVLFGVDFSGAVNAIGSTGWRFYIHKTGTDLYYPGAGGWGFYFNVTAQHKFRSFKHLTTNLAVGSWTVDLQVLVTLSGVAENQISFDDYDWFHVYAKEYVDI